jgi:hypothetical protein
VGLLFAVAMLAAACGGCGPQMGGYLLFLSPPTKKIPATYKLSPGPVLVLVDDDQGAIRPPIAKTALVDAMARELKLHKLSEKVTTNEELSRLRQSEAKFDQRGAREVGKLAEADKVIWVSTQSFAIEDDLEIASTPARWAVTVRVIDAKATSRDKVRLWPSETTERNGRLVEVALQPHELRGAKSVQEAHQRLADAMAVKVTELFYDQVVENR